MSDALDDFLDRGSSYPPDDHLRQALRGRTTRVLRRRRRLKKVGLAVAFAACFAAGMATMRFLLTPQTAEQPPAPAPLVVEKKAEPAPAMMPQTATVLEWQARAQPDQRSARLRQAAAKYLEEEFDYAAALRCYTQALDAGGPQALESSPDDD